MPDIHADRVLILDFGAQYTQLIARRVRELGVYSEIYACDVDAAQIERFAPKAIILSGGPESVYDVKGPEAPPEVFSLGVPVLGICYGMQTMAAQLGGEVQSSSHREFGLTPARRPRRQSGRARPPGARRLDEPRRSRRGAALGVQGHRLERQCAARGDGG
jgi:GMP synthase-like glutamine amidotransferase